MNVGDLMTRNLRTLTADATVADAMALMKENRVRHIPVVDVYSQRLLGIVSDRDIKRIVSPFVGTVRETRQDRKTIEMLLEHVMAKKLTTVSPDASLREAVEKILQKGVSCLPVVDDTGKLLGIITSSDLLRQMLTLL